MKKTALSLVSAALAIVSMSGCLGLHFGGGTKSSVRNTSATYDVTLGQQLIDLQKAYQAGIITESQYDSQKKKLLRHYVQ